MNSNSIGLCALKILKETTRQQIQPVWLFIQTNLFSCSLQPNPFPFLYTYTLFTLITSPTPFPFFTPHSSPLHYIPTLFILFIPTPFFLSLHSYPLHFHYTLILFTFNTSSSFLLSLYPLLFTFNTSSSFLNFFTPSLSSLSLHSHPLHFLYTLKFLTCIIIIIIMVWGARGVVVIAVGNEHGDTSSNPGREWLHFT